MKFVVLFKIWPYILFCHFDPIHYFSLLAKGHLYSGLLLQAYCCNLLSKSCIRTGHWIDVTVSSRTIKQWALQAAPGKSQATFLNLKKKKILHILWLYITVCYHSSYLQWCHVCVFQKATCQRTWRHKLLLSKKKLISGLEIQFSGVKNDLGQLNTIMPILS